MNEITIRSVIFEVKLQVVADEGKWAYTQN